MKVKLNHGYHNRNTNKNIPLSPRERALLQFMADRRGVLVTYQELIAAWGAIDTFAELQGAVSDLRGKVQGKIVNFEGVGYVYVPYEEGVNL